MNPTMGEHAHSLKIAQRKYNQKLLHPLEVTWPAHRWAGSSHRRPESCGESGEQAFDYMAVHVGQTAVNAIVIERELLVIQTQEVQERGVEVRNRHRVLSREVADFIRGAVMSSGANAGA